MIELKSIPFFVNFSDKDIKMLKDNSTLVNYNANDIVYYERDKPKYLFLLIEGGVNVYKTNSKGRQLHIHTVNPVDFLGELAVFYKIPYHNTTECITKCKILKIDYYELNKNFCKDLFFCKELVNSLNSRITALMQVVDSSFLTTKERVARFILKNLNEFKDSTYTDISKRLNMTPETFSRILNDFKRKKLIDMDSEHNITIIDKNTLLEISE